METTETTETVRPRSSTPFERKFFFGWVVGLYLFPFSLFILFFFSSIRSFHFSTLLFWLSIAFAGTIGILVLLKYWEKKMQRSVGILVQLRLQQLSLSSSPIEQASSQEEKVHELQNALRDLRREFEHQIDLLQTSVVKSREKAEESSLELEKKEADCAYYLQACEEMQKELDRRAEENQRLNSEREEKTNRHALLLNEYQHTIAEQRTIIEKKQRYIAKLEGKVRDLMYEIRSLLQLEESTSRSSGEMAPFVEIVDSSIENSSPNNFSSYAADSSPYDLSLQLQRYIQLAQTFMGVEHLGYVNGKSPRYLDLSFDSYAIDLRRLFDSLREDTIGIIFVYSRAEERFLFFNNAVKPLLGWSAEKFMKEFPHLIETGFPEWHHAILRLPALKETKVRLSIRSKVGEEILFQCFMGIVSQGPFSNHVIGIMAPTQDT